MDKQMLSILDIIMSEYGWSLEYVIKLPITIIQDLCKIIGDKKREDDKFRAKLQTIAIGAAFSDKGFDLIDKVFKTKADREDDKDSEVDEQAQKGQMRELWVRMGKNLNDFEEQYSKGEVQF